MLLTWSSLSLLMTMIGFIWFTGHSPFLVEVKARTPGRNLKSGTETQTIRDAAYCLAFCGLAPATFSYHPGPPDQGRPCHINHQSRKHPMLAYKPIQENSDRRIFSVEVFYSWTMQACIRLKEDYPHTWPCNPSVLDSKCWD